MVVSKSHVKKGRSLAQLPKTSRQKISIDSTKLKKFCNLWSLNTPKTTIEKELKIKTTQYYSYINAAEEIVDDFLLGMVDHGLVLQFRNVMERVNKRAEKLDDLADKALDNYEKMDIPERNVANRLIANANSTDKLFSEMLDDTKIVNETVKTLNKVIVKSTQKTTNEGKSNGI